MTLKEAIYKLLQDDAKLHTGTELGSLLAHYAASPYGIFFSTPPAEPSLPLVTYFISGQSVGGNSNAAERDIFINVTAWGSNFEAVQNRIYALLHNARLVTTDYQMLMIQWDQALAELWDAELKCYYRQDRYWLKGLKV